jgi:hypothetical protein
MFLFGIARCRIIFALFLYSCTGRIAIPSLQLLAKFGALVWAHSFIFY